MSSASETKPKARKVRLIFLLFLGLALIAVAVWLSAGLGGQLIEQMRYKNFIKTTHGLAISDNNLDPHISKIETEYRSLIDIARLNNPDGIWEKTSAGNYAYESLTADEVGQHTIETTIIYGDIEKARQTYEQLTNQLITLGYEFDPQTQPSDSASSYIRLFVAADEQSAGSPGNDKMIISFSPTNKDGKARLNMFYQSTETPLKGLPNADKDYTVAEYDELIQKIVSGEIDICNYQPNGAIGGWYPEYSCQKDYL